MDSNHDFCEGNTFPPSQHPSLDRAKLHLPNSWAIPKQIFEEANTLSTQSSVS
jgi:hypothetical protein